MSVDCSSLQADHGSRCHVDLLEGTGHGVVVIKGCGQFEQQELWNSNIHDAHLATIARVVLIGRRMSRQGPAYQGTRMARRNTAQVEDEEGTTGGGGGGGGGGTR